MVSRLLDQRQDLAIEQTFSIPLFHTCGSLGQMNIAYDRARLSGLKVHAFEQAGPS